MCEDEIADEMGDLAALETLFAARLADVRRSKDALKRQRVDKGLDQRTVTDHALIRYLERHCGMDVNALREELRTIASEAVPAKDGEHHWHPSGVILIIGDAGQVITVLSQEQAAKHGGRKLKNGRRVPEAESLNV